MNRPVLQQQSEISNKGMRETCKEALCCFVHGKKWKVPFYAFIHLFPDFPQTKQLCVLRHLKFFVLRRIVRFPFFAINRTKALENLLQPSVRPTLRHPSSGRVRRASSRTLRRTSRLKSQEEEIWNTSLYRKQKRESAITAELRLLHSFSRRRSESGRSCDRSPEKAAER